MARGYLPLLLTVALLWGASYMFIKVAVEEIEPAPTMALRLALSAPPLIAFVLWRMGGRRAVRELRAARREGLLLGVINNALPFWLIAWGEKYIDSGVAAIANASVPIFVALLALKFLPSERIGGLRLAGVLIGLLGVGVLAGLDPRGGWWAVAGTLAVVLASLSYAIGQLYGQHRVSRTAGPVLAAASTTAGALVLLPLALLQLPEALPSWQALGSVLALALLGTTLAQLIMFRMLRLHGAARFSLVTYLLPVTALLYGVVLLDEVVTASMLAGLVLILSGVALGSGAVRLPRAAVTAAP